MIVSSTNLGSAGLLFRTLAALGGLLLLRVGCDLTSAPLHIGGPMNLAFNPFGVPLVALGVAGVTLVPVRGWTIAWPLAALLALGTAGVTFWQHVPIEDGAFQSLRAGVPDPDPWPAPAFLYALALAPVGVALAALLPGPRRIVPLLLASAAGAVASGLLLEAFSGALLREGTGAALVALGVPAAALLTLAMRRAAHPATRAVAGQSAVLLGLCALLWIAWHSVV